MTPDPILDAELQTDEGDKLFLYDDANGARIVKGYTVIGTPTIGAGVNITFLYPEEDAFLLHNREQRAIDALGFAFPWFAGLDDNRRRALIDLYYNVPAFVRWPRFIGFASSGNWANAAAELENTHPWIDEVKDRGRRIAEVLRNG